LKAYYLIVFSQFWLIFWPNAVEISVFWPEFWLNSVGITILSTDTLTETGQNFSIVTEIGQNFGLWPISVEISSVKNLQVGCFKIQNQFFDRFFRSKFGQSHNSDRILWLKNRSKAFLTEFGGQKLFLTDFAIKISVGNFFSRNNWSQSVTDRSK